LILEAKDFENPFFQVLTTSNDIIEVAYMDLEERNNFSPMTYPQELAITTKNKYFELKEITVSKSTDLKNQLKRFLLEEAISKASMLGLKPYSVNSYKLDILMDEMPTKSNNQFGKESKMHLHYEHMMGKINGASNVIAMNSRIGPAQYMIINSNTYKFLYPYFSTCPESFSRKGDREYVFRTGNHPFGDLPVYIHDSMKDDLILLGRKGQPQDGGIKIAFQDNGQTFTPEISLSTIWRDQQVDKRINCVDNNSYVKLKYSIVEVGSNLHNFYYTIYLDRGLVAKRKAKLNRLSTL